MTVLVVIMGILVQLTTSVQRIWRRGTDVSDTARTAQRTLDLLASDLAAAVAGGSVGSGREVATDSTSPLLFAVLHDSDEASSLDADGDCSSDSFSRLLFTSQLPRPVWGETESDGSLHAPLRRDTGSRLRSVIGVQYRIVETASADDDADSSESDSSEPLRFSLVRTVAGLESETSSERWWEKIDDLPGEPIARNVVWFSVSVPTFLSAATNETDTLDYEFRSYTTRTDSTLPEASDATTGPLPPLVDIVLGLVPERDLLQIESMPDDADRQELLQMRTRVYTRRVALPGN